jgi:hypothetical protein
MAHYHARSGATRSDALVSGLYTRGVVLTIGGSTRTSQITKSDSGTPQFSIRMGLDDQRGEARIWTRRFLPTLYHDVILRNGGANGVILFRGRVLGLDSTAAHQSLAARHEMSCVGDHWLMDRFARVTARYRQQGANTIVAHILANFTNGGFATGSIPSSLGNIETIDFSDEFVSKAITRVARALDPVAVWRLDAERRVSMTATTFPDGNALTLASSTKGYWNFRIGEDGDQTRTRVFYEGEGSFASEAVGASTGTIPVEETRFFLSAGGVVRVNQNTVTYTGVSASSGPGNLTGCSGIVFDIGAGEPVNVLVQSDDSAAQTAVATALGGGLSGVIVAVQQDGRLSAAECDTRGTADLLNSGTPPKSVGYATANEFTRVGKMVAVNVTAPRTVNSSFRIQSVTITPRGKFTTTEVNFEYTVQAGPFRRSLPDVLAGVVRAPRLSRPL